jgi:carboxypeptidase D
MGFPGSFPDVQTSPVYFDRADVKAALHASPDKTWSECTDANVFQAGRNGTDGSLPPTFSVLPNVIEKSERSVIVHGLADYVLIAEGARIALQNMTWGGKQGFQKAITTDSFVIDGIGAYGNVQSERNLTYYEVSLSGHMVPQFAPWVSVCSSMKQIFLTIRLTGWYPKHAVSNGIQGDAVRTLCGCYLY